MERVNSGQEDDPKAATFNFKHETFNFETGMTHDHTQDFEHKHEHGIEPLGSTLVLDCTPVEVRTAGGIVLTPAVQGADTRMEATIVARGPECSRTELAVGRRVFVGKYASNEILRGDRKYRLAEEAAILALLV